MIIKNVSSDGHGTSNKQESIIPSPQLKYYTANHEIPIEWPLCSLHPCFFMPLVQQTILHRYKSEQWINDKYMCASAQTSLLINNCHSSGWTAEAFFNTNDTKIALCHDQAGFPSRDNPRRFFPTDIWKVIVHPNPSTHIRGFKELFILLNTDPDADDLH